MKFNLRSVFFLTVTTLAVVFALLCVTGRILAWQAPNHEQRINEYLSSYGLRVEGLKIRWSALNPIVHIDKVEATGVYAEGVEFELDVFLSLWRNRFSLSNLLATHVHFEIDLSEQGRTVTDRGSRPSGFGAIGVLLDSQNFDVAFTGVMSTSGGVAQTILGKLQSQTVDGRRDVLVGVETAGSCEGCGLEIRYFRRRSAFLFPDIIESLHVEARDFDLFPAAWNLPYLRNLSLTGTLDLRSRNGLGKALADFQIQTSNETRSAATMTGILEANLIKNELHGVLDQVVVSVEDVDTALPVVNIASNSSSGLSYVWVDHADTGALDTLVNGFGVTANPVVAWIAGLQLQAEIHDFQLRHEVGSIVFRANASEVRTKPYSVVPGAQIERLSVVGKNRNFLLSASDTEAIVDFPRWFEQPRTISNMRGSVLLGFSTNQLGVRIVVEGAAYDGDEIAGRFGYSMDHTDQVSMGLSAEAREIDIQNLQQFIPSGTGKAVRSWLVDNIEEGILHDVKAVYHNADRPDQTQDSSIFEASVGLTEVIAHYHDDWPQLNDARGYVWLTEKSLDVDLSSCHTAGILVNSGDVHVSFEDFSVDVNFSADSDVALLLDYVKATPLSEVVGIDLNSVKGSGQADIVSSLQFQQGQNRPQADVSLTLHDAALTLNSPNVEVTDLGGSIHYSTPFALSGQDLVGSVLGRVGPIEINTESSDDETTLRVQFESRFGPEDIVPYVGEWIKSVAKGESDLRLNLEFATEGSKVPFIEVESSLQGFELNFPEPLGKSADKVQATLVRIELGDIPRVSLDSGIVMSVFDLRQDGGLHGSIGLNVPPLEYGPENVGLLVTGNLDSLKLDDSPSEGNGLILPTLITLQRLFVNRVEAQALTFSDVLVDGIYSQSEIDLAIESNELVGRVSKLGEDPLLVEINRIQFELQESRTDDPLSPEMLNWIPTMSVRVDDILLVDQDQQESSFGSWTMDIDVRENELSVSEIKSDVKGLMIDGGITWNTSENTTRFLGNVQAEKLQEVLPQWDYDPNVESKALKTAVDFSWPGSPLMFDLYAATGSLTGDLDEGRFLDVNAAGGALRIAGLLNFAVVLDQLRLNFKDVFREGTSFNRIMFDVQTDKGILRIEEPLHIKTTGSDILLAGTMNLNTDTLDMEVVVTLPVSSSLPWWVGIATANPIAVISTLVGKKILEGPLNRMSSMKYRVTGSLDDPSIQFEGLFRDRLEGENETDQEGTVTVEGNKENE